MGCASRGKDGNIHAGGDIYSIPIHPIVGRLTSRGFHISDCSIEISLCDKRFQDGSIQGRIRQGTHGGNWNSRVSHTSTTDEEISRIVDLHSVDSVITI